MGMVNRIVPHGSLEDYTRQHYATIADNAPMTIHVLKRTMDELAQGDKADLAAYNRLAAGLL